MAQRARWPVSIQIRNILPCPLANQRYRWKSRLPLDSKTETNLPPSPLHNLISPNPTTITGSYAGAAPVVRETPTQPQCPTLPHPHTAAAQPSTSLSFAPTYSRPSPHRRYACAEPSPAPRAAATPSKVGTLTLRRPQQTTASGHLHHGGRRTTAQPAHHAHHLLSSSPTTSRHIPSLPTSSISHLSQFHS